MESNGVRCPQYTNTKFTHRLWSLPNATLEYCDLETQQNHLETRNRTEEFLTRNVYADLVDGKHQHNRQQFSRRELSNNFPNAHAPFDAEGWEYEFLGELAPAKRQVTADDVSIAGRNKKARWLKQELLDELPNRNKPRDKKATINDLKDELFAFQAIHENDLNNQVGIYPRHGLDQWGIEQRGHVDSCADADYGDTSEDNLSPFRLYTWALHLSPFNPTYWVSRAYLFHQKGYYDLTLGDAYRAYFLTEVLQNGATIPGLYARVWDAIEQHVYANAQNPYIPLNDFNNQERINAQASAALDLTRSPEGLLSFVPHLRRTIHHIISLNLLSSQAWVDWWKMDAFAYKLQQEEHAQPFLLRLETNQGHANRRNKRQKDDHTLWKHEKSAGSISGKEFLQSAKDVDRTAEAFLATLNAKFFGPWPGKKDRSPAIEVRRKADGELGVFALKAFEQNELIHIEEPSIRDQVRGRWASHIPESDPQPAPCEDRKRPISYDFITDAEWSRLDKSERDKHQNVCRCIDAEPRRYFCQPFRPQGLGITGIDMNPQQPTVSRDEDDEVAIGVIDGSSAQAPESRASKRKATDNNENDQPPTTRTTRSGNRPTRASKPSRPSTRTKKRKVEPLVDDIAVVEPEMTCLQKARETYHFKSCGKAWEWLHVQLTLTEPAYPGGYTEINHEEHGTLLSFLLLDVFDRTLLLRTQQPNSHILAHEVDDLLPLCGVVDLPEQHFPFTYSANIVVPFDILLNLGVKIFRELDFDT